MLKVINKVYLMLGLILYTFFIPKMNEEYLFINLFVMFMFISYFIVVQFNIKLEEEFYTKSTLIFEVFIYSLIVVSVYDLISYYYHNDFFSFSNSDAVSYHMYASKMVHMSSFGEAIDFYLRRMGVDDLGMILVLYPLYKIYESNLTLNIFYVFVGIITALSIFNISLNFMSRRYAFLAALSYTLSSYVLFYHSTGLKESFMIMLILLFFDYYYRFITKKSIVYFIISLIFLFSLLLFRPAIIAMILVGVGISALVDKNGNASVKLISFLIIFLLLVNINKIMAIVQTYTTGGVDSLIEARESVGGIKGGIAFTYIVNILSQAIGPIPTLITMDRILTMYYAPGLLYKVLLSFSFWMGVFYIFKQRLYAMYPLLLFALMEMSSLAYLLDGLELRKALPHFAVVYIVSFWFLDKYDNEKIVFKSENFKFIFKSFILFLALIVLYWNFR